MGAVGGDSPDGLSIKPTFGFHKSNRRFVYHAGSFATSSQKTHCDGFLYSSGYPVEDDHRLCEGFDDGA